MLGKDNLGFKTTHIVANLFIALALKLVYMYKQNSVFMNWLTTTLVLYNSLTMLCIVVML